MFVGRGRLKHLGLQLHVAEITLRGMLDIGWVPSGSRERDIPHETPGASAHEGVGSASLKPHGRMLLSISHGWVESRLLHRQVTVSWLWRSGGGLMVLNGRGFIVSIRSTVLRDQCVCLQC